MKTTVEINTNRIEYSITGENSNPAIIFIHGLGANLSQFEKQHEYFSSNFQVLSVNLSGHGNSSSASPFSLEKSADQIILLADKLGIEKFHLVGNSMGGNVSYEILNKYEERLLSFITFGTTAELHISAGTTKILLFIYRLLSMKAIAGMAKSAGRSDNAKKQIYEMMASMNKESLLKIVPILADFNFLSIIEKSKVPAMIIQGGKDSDINRSLNSTIEAFEKRGNFKLVSLPGAGHFANMDCHDVFNRTLSAFLKDN